MTMMPLDGIKVLDMTRLAPGPFCTMVLGEFGADVLRIEQPIGLPQNEEERNAQKRASAFNPLNRNKRSIALDLMQAEAQQVVYKLTETADVYVEGFRPGRVEEMGVDYETLSKINPRLVYCSISGYGQDGPYRGLVGHDINYISFGGALGVIGQAGGPPVIPSNIVGDYGGGGLLAAMSILSALMVRDRTGRGQYVDISMTDGVLYLLASLTTNFMAQGTVPQRGTDRLNGGLPQYNVYECADGKYLSVGCLEDRFFDNLVRALGRDDFVGHVGDPAQREEQFTFFREAFKAKSCDDWFDELILQGDIAVGKVNDLAEVFRDPQILQRQMLVDAGEWNGETVKQVGIGPKLSKTPGSIRALGPFVGEHTDTVLSDLGYGDDDVARMRERGLVG